MASAGRTLNYGTIILFFYSIPRPNGFSRADPSEQPFSRADPSEQPFSRADVENGTIICNKIFKSKYDKKSQPKTDN
jgi:hypothetical protein